ncbi:MAG: hypothetical protein CMF41_03330 [Legionellales bacterium]|nr:hypothetical protein [Legionellales bacterium]
MNHSLWTRIQLEGNQRILQNLICCDLENVHSDPQWSALCDSSGKVLATLWIHKQNQQWIMDLPSTMKDQIIQHIQRYALRNRFKIDDASIPKDERFHLRYNITHLMPCIEPSTSSQFTPQMLAVDRVPNAICWTKGCYLGQEVIMRLQQLGKIKRVIKAFQFNGEVDSLKVTTEDGKSAGQIINSIHDQKEHLFSMIVNVDHGTLFVDDQLIKAL